MDIAAFLTPDRVLLDTRARDKLQLIKELCGHLVRSAPNQKAEIFEAALLAREQLGSTGLGNGFALPHARIEGLTRYLGLFARLAKPIEFAAIDGKHVSLVFVLLIPSAGEASQVAALAAISRLFRNPELVANLRQAQTLADAYGLLTAP